MAFSNIPTSSKAPIFITHQPFPFSFSLQKSHKPTSTKIACDNSISSSNPNSNRKPYPKRINKFKDKDSSEEREIVSLILKNNANEKRPLVVTMSKYAKVVRMEHCFLLFEELGKGGQWLHCLEVFRWMQKQRWYIADNGVYSKLISVMGKKGQTRMAMWLFSEMRKSGCRPDTSVYNSLITAHLHSRDKVKALDKAVGYFEKMKGMERCKPNVVTYNILLRAFAKARKVNQVDTLFKDLGESMITPDIYTFNGVMDAYGKNGMIREMESVLARMKIAKCKPDIITFNLLIDAYGKKQEFEKMEQVLTSLLRSKEKPTLATFNSMIINYGKARRRDKAESVFQRMKDMGYSPSYITYETLIMVYGLCDSSSKARETFDEFRAFNKEVKVSTFNAMIDAYCMNNLLMEADMFLYNARDVGVRPNSSTYKLLYRAYTKANAKEYLEKLLKCMDRDGIVPTKKFFLDALGASGSSTKKSEPDSGQPTTDASSKQSATKA